MFKDLILSMCESIELVMRTTRQQEPNLEVKISCTRSMLKTIGGCMSSMAVRCIPKPWPGSCKPGLSEESVKEGKVVRCVPTAFPKLLEL